MIEALLGRGMGLLSGLSQEELLAELRDITEAHMSRLLW